MNIVDRTIVFKLTDENDFTNLNKRNEVSNFIADLRGVDLNVINNVKQKFITFDASISKINGSFVIVSDISFDNDLVIVPTLQEAYDYIEMEEIERQLEL